MYFGDGGTNYWFYDILITPIFLDFWYVFLGGFPKIIPIKKIMLQFCLGPTLKWLD